LGARWDMSLTFQFNRQRAETEQQSWTNGRRCREAETGDDGDRPVCAFDVSKVFIDGCGQ